MITVFHAGVDIGVPDPVHCTPQMLKRYFRDSAARPS